MYINKIDELFDNILNKLDDYLIKHKTFQAFSKDTNFVKYQNQILETLKDFIDKNVSKKFILDLLKNESYYEYVFGIIKRYCAFYIYLGIAYHYKGGRDLFITNIIESSKNQKDSIFSIPNFYNSENNSKMITFFNDIKHIESLIETGKSMDKIKILIANNPLKFDSTLKLFNDLGEDYIIENFIKKDNFHNIIKTLIFRQIYLKEEKNEIITLLNQEEKEAGEYIYIEIIKSNEKKLIDFSLIQKFLSLQELKSGLAEEIYDFLLEMRENKEFIIRENKDFINFLFSKEVLIPINEDFLRFNDNNEKYDTESIVSDSLKERDATKMKYIMSKLNNIRNLYAPIMEKNLKLKLEAEKLFNLSYEPRKALIYNDNEEIKIIQKLKSSDNAGDKDLLIDLENIRKYPFVNFRNFSKDGIKLRTKRTIESIRYISLKKKKKEPLDIRVGHDNLDLAVVGVAWNPTKKPLDSYTVDDLINVNTLSKDKNNFNNFVKALHRKNEKLYYWLFDINLDKIKTTTYEDTNSLKTMISQIYNNYIDLIKNKYEDYIKTLDEITIWDSDNLLKAYSKVYFDFNLNPEIRNFLIEKTLSKLKELEITVDEVDEMIPGKRAEMIKLPTYKYDTKEKNIIKINFEKEEEIELEKIRNEPICLHYLKWRNVNRLAKIKTDEFSQAVVDFGKQYIKLNKNGDYVCKSCNEELSIKKFIYEGTYVEELDTFMTTNIAINQRLEEIPKYSGFLRIIRNLEKNVEKIAYAGDLITFIGTSPTIRLKRKLIIKDVLDLILLHTEYLRKHAKNRPDYGINKDYTNLFFFELKDEIFLTSSTDTDYYKLIKYNNVVTYLLFFIVLDINPGQILNLKEDKFCNFFIFDKVGKTLFKDIYLRINQKDKILIEKIPLLCYVIYYFSSIFINSRIWLWNDNVEGRSKDELAKLRQTAKINTQKTIICTLIDLMNSLGDANFDVDSKNFLYEFINNKFSQKVKINFNDAVLLKRIEEKSAKKVNYDQTTKKITYAGSKDILINIEESKKLDITNLSKHKDSCESTLSEMDNIENLKPVSNLDLLTNCPDGKFHKWKFDNNDMVCTLCNQSYNELVKLYQRSTSPENENKMYLHKLKILNLEKLAKKYCISGEFHELNSEGKCKLCGKDPNIAKFSDKDLEKMEKNLEELSYETNLESIKQMKINLEKIEAEKNKVKSIVEIFNKAYESETNNKVYSYVSDFTDRLSKILGNKIKINNEVIYLKDNVYILDHDYFGNARKEVVYILSSENKIETYKNHPNYKKDVIYYKDKSHNVYVYYDLITFQYLGYSENNKEFKKTKSNSSLKMTLSIRDSLMLLGNENKYINLFHLITDENLFTDSYYIVSNYLRTRILNLNQIISRTNSIVNNINHNGRFNSLYGSEEKSLIDEFTKKIKNFNIDDVFKNLNVILNNLDLKPIPDNIKIETNQNYFDCSNMNYLNNSDCRLIYFLVSGFNKLLDNNKQISIQSELSYLIIKLIKFSFNQYFRPYSDSNIRKFDHILINEVPYKDDSLKVVGFYQELLTNQEVEDKKDKEKDENYDSQQAFESLDIDDYDVDDDYDGAMEALDNPGE